MNVDKNCSENRPYNFKEDVKLNPLKSMEDQVTAIINIYDYCLESAPKIEKLVIGLVSGDWEFSWEKTDDPTHKIIRMFNTTDEENADLQDWLKGDKLGYTLNPRLMKLV